MKAKTKTQLLNELAELRQRIAALEAAEAEHRQADERWQLLSSAVEQSSEGIAISGLEGNLLYVNRAFAAMHGYSPEELVGKHLSIFHTPEQMPSVEVANQQLQATGEFTGEIWHVRRDGTIFPTLMRNSILRDDEGKPIGMIGTLRDITERKQEKEEIWRRLQEMALLNVITTTIASATNVDEALQNICAELARFLRIPQAGFAMLNPQRTAAKVIADYHPPDSISAIGWTLPVINNPSMAYILEHKVPLAIADAQHDPLLAPVHEIMRQRNAKSILIVPIIAGGEVIGTIGFDAFQRREFSASEIKLVQHVAGHLGQMLMRKQVEEALRRERDLAKALEEAAAVLSSTLDLDQVLDRILEQVSRVVPHDAANVMLVQGDQARIVRWRGYERFGAEEFVSTVTFNILDVPNLRQMMESKEPMFIPDTATYPGWVHVPVQEWLRSYAAAPIVVRDEVIGFLNVDSVTPGFFTQAHAGTLRAFADHAAAAIQNARLFEAQRRRNEELETLRQASLRLTSTLELQPILEAILDHALQLMSADDAHVFLYDGQQLAFGAALWAGGRQQKPYSEPRPHGLTYTVAHSGEWIVVPDMSDHPLFRDRQWHGAIVGLPLRIGERVVGVMNIASQKPRAFDENELRALELLADQAAIAIRNARLYEAAQQELAERKRTEEALQESEEKYRNLVERANDGIVIVQDTLVKYTNSRLAEITGYTVEEMLGTLYANYIHPDELPKVVGHYERRMAGEEVRSIYETALRHKDGSKVDVEINAGIITFQGRPANLAFIRDITERKRLEEQLLQAQKMEAVGRLAGGVAHDFNNLLTAIIGYSDLLLMGLSQDNPLHRDVAEIKKAADRAASLTSQLLAFSRKQVLQPTVLDLNATVANIEKMLRRLIREDIQLVTVLDPTLERVKADPGQIEQVLMNLAVNARDAMPQGGKLTIETANAYLDEDYARQHLEVQPGPYVMLAVSDTGVGMNEETQSHLFEPFFTTKEVGRGTGLGLATVYGIVKQSGGHVWVSSEPGRGTTIKVYLPRIEESIESDRQAQFPAAPLQGQETVLLVEDEDVVRNLARRVLLKRGYTVLEASDGGEALHLCEQHKGPIHLLVTDVVMPGGMSGRELAERLTPLQPEMRVLYISGYTDDAIIHHGVLETGTAFLQKPFTPAALANKVREMLDTP
jgi:two-component system cell cycle sensor histidine kinase/response regulator CckA